MSKRKSVVQRAWTAAEDDTLLRAWADVAERRPKSQVKGLMQSYHALLGAAAVELERSSLALQNRRAMYVRMHDIICAFHAHIQQEQQEQQTRRNDGDNASGDATATTTPAAASATPEHPEPKYSSASWFELSVREQKRWFASRDTKTYPFHEIQRDAFERAAAILKLNNHDGKGDLSRRQASYTRPKVEKRAEEDEGEAEQLEDGDDGDEDGSDSDGTRGPLLTTHIRAMIDRLAKQKTTAPPVRPIERESDGGCIRPYRYVIRPEKEEGGDDDMTTTTTTTTTTNKADAAAVGGSNDGDGNSDGGSSTESDDGILSCWDENGDAIVPRSPMMVTANVKAEPESSIKTLQDDPFKQPSDQQSPHQQVDNVVDPDLLELVSILETQVRHLGKMFRQTKKVRKEESRGRRYIMKNIQLDREEKIRVLEDLKQREEELQRERDEWQLERSNMKRELAQLREQTSARSHEAASERPE